MKNLGSGGLRVEGLGWNETLGSTTFIIRDIQDGSSCKLDRNSVNDCEIINKSWDGLTC
jgi:hypothetical protein